MIDEGLVTYLQANVPTIAGRVHASKLPPSPVFPCLTYFEVSHVPDNTHDGFSGLTVSRFQVTSWTAGVRSGGTDYAGAKTLAAEVETALNAFRGLMGTTQVDSCFAVGGGADFYDAEPDLWQVSRDFMIAYHP